MKSRTRHRLVILTTAVMYAAFFAAFAILAFDGGHRWAIHAFTVGAFAAVGRHHLDQIPARRQP